MTREAQTMTNPQPTDNDAAPVFASWEAKHYDASRIVNEAGGWARSVDPSDDDALLAWARHYFPRIVAHDRTDVTSPGGNT